MSNNNRHMSSSYKFHQKKLISQLKKIWLNETDAKIYLFSIHIGACTIKQLTDQSSINRITVHDSVGRLIEKGLLQETYSNKKRLVFPQPIENLQHIVEIKKTEVNNLQQQVNTTINILQSLHLQSSYLPQIRLSKGRAWIKDLLWEIKNAKPKELYTISDSRHFDELLNIKFLEEMKKTQIHMILPRWFEHFIFSAHAKWVSINTKTLTNETNRSWGMTLREDTVALHAYEGVYITTTIIKNEAITQTMKHVFENTRKMCS